MYISENFDIIEFSKSNEAERLKIDNSIPDDAIENIKYLTVHLLQPLRNRYGYPMNINSGYRSPELNKAVGGVASSQHLKGEAADIGCKDPKLLLQHLKNSRLTFDQAIIYPNFLHLSLSKTKNRNQIIIK